jgi:hypothetical protein
LLLAIGWRAGLWPFERRRYSESNPASAPSRNKVRPARFMNIGTGQAAFLIGSGDFRM